MVHNAAMADYEYTDAFRGARFTGSDLAGLTIRSCDVRNLKIVDSYLSGANISGMFKNVTVNDVDVTEFVRAELDRRFPERVELRRMRTAEDYRAMWRTLERCWAETVARAQRLPEPARHERVDGEWSFAETLRHLVFATDKWLGEAVLDKPEPYHRLGLIHVDPGVDAAALGLDLDARPSYAEVLEARADRVAQVRGVVDGLTDAQLEQECPRPPEESNTVGHCLSVVMDEECEHRRYAERDLAVLQARYAG